MPGARVRGPVAQRRGEALTRVHIHALDLLGVGVGGLDEALGPGEPDQHRHDGDEDGGADEQRQGVLPAERK